ncbi:hypothetical protein [Streptomyces sp. CBMA123]|uniref:hypothetical protein n=1 Tax=Streptomyces sp. CBMA123 TaxID=1896313 RepID=UPI001661F329|nr:hypothetical protein [Streptomyces sp. CBMA123]MBD0694049.1 hypothetical protein [Streptomyces sp. CBMA123]
MSTGSELAGGLASAAASRLIDLLATDGWAAVKASVLALWRHAHPERLEADLAEARSELMQSGGDSEIERLLVAEWQARLARLLAARPEIAEELRALLLDASAGTGLTGQQPMGSTTLTAHVSDGGSAYQAGRDMHITEGGTA